MILTKYVRRLRSNGNSIPICVWMLMYAIHDPSLFASIREEVESVLITDPSTGDKMLDLQKMLALPLLQSLYVECLRLHVSINVTREAVEPVMFEGYLLEKGAIIQGPAEIIHYEDENWGKEGHPASEFWAERHIKYADSDEVDSNGEKKKVRQFEMSGRAAEFIPYGMFFSISMSSQILPGDLELTDYAWEQAAACQCAQVGSLPSRR